MLNEAARLSVIPLPTPTDNKTKILLFLMALQSDFEHICGVILHLIPLSTVDAGFSEVLAKEQTPTSLSEGISLTPKWSFVGTSNSHSSLVNSSSELVFQMRNE